MLHVYVLVTLTTSKDTRAHTQVESAIYLASQFQKHDEGIGHALYGKGHSTCTCVSITPLLLFPGQIPTVRTVLHNTAKVRTPLIMDLVHV